MDSAKQQEAARRRIDRFATEWAMWDGNTDTGEQSSEDGRPVGLAPVSSIDEIGRHDLRSNSAPRKGLGAA